MATADMPDPSDSDYDSSDLEFDMPAAFADRAFGQASIDAMDANRHTLRVSTKRAIKTLQFRDGTSPGSLRHSALWKRRFNYFREHVLKQWPKKPFSAPWM
ncbi:unnamed protein product [Periconia digitata]|uniref:Uncharacterized protein n=1 Tax=Periconia digitata TaxID=1303443 RepID=A0A9W4UTW6_9PLEO|nr:unnamed protein product [Periconia digitata]